VDEANIKRWDGVKEKVLHVGERHLGIDTWGFWFRALIKNTLSEP